MDHIRILRRAFEITRFYRALWVFGILVALTASRGGSGSPGGGGSGSNGTGNSPFSNPYSPFQVPTIPGQVINTLIGVGIALICFFILLGIGMAILRYLSQTSLIRMVNGYEGSGEKVSVGQGFRLGWSRGAFRIWLVDLLFFVIGFAGFMLLLALAAAPLLLWLTRTRVFEVIGTIVTIGLVMLIILLLVIVAAAVSLWKQLIQREIILNGLGVFEGIRAGWQVLRRHLGDVIIMGLILFGIGLVIGILFIPLFFMLGLVGVIAGGLPALLAGGVTAIFTHGMIPGIVAAVVGVPILLAIIILPLLFVNGLVETFYSSVWTLTYRELLAMEAVRSETPIQPGPEPVV
jgi:hypothetical protein